MKIKKKKIDFDKNPSKFSRIWNDPVWSQLIAAAIITITSFVISNINSSFDINYDTLGKNVLSLLTAELQFYWLIIIITGYVVLYMTVRYCIKKKKLLPVDYIYAMKIGDFRFIELINALKSHYIETNYLEPQKNKTDFTLFDYFICYARTISNGIYCMIEDDEQEQILYHTICPLLEAYGLATRVKEANPKPDANDKINFYYLSENGKIFYQAVQVYRTYINEKLIE